MQSISICTWPVTWYLRRRIRCIFCTSSYTWFNQNGFKGKHSIHDDVILVMLFSFLPKNVHFILKKNAILCLCLKNVSPSKRVVCFILNNLHFPNVEGIIFYALYESRMLIISCKANDFCLFIGLPDEI